jgi:hypothetical protein
MCQRWKRFALNSAGRQGRHARPVALQEGDGKCVLCPTYPLLERRFRLGADEHRHRLSQTRPRLIAREQANAVVGCANPPHPFPRGRSRCCTRKSENYPKGAVEDYPRKAFAAGRLFRNLPCEFRRSHQRKFEDTSRACRYAVDRSFLPWTPPLVNCGRLGSKQHRHHSGLGIT